MNENARLLEIRGLESVYEGDFETVHALNQVHLSVDRGETLGLVGETGAGKTTVALSIMKLLPPKVGVITGGEILFKGEDVVTASEARMRKVRGSQVSMIFQDPMTSLNPVVTVGEQIREALELHNESKRTKEQIEERVDQLLGMVGIQKNRKAEFPHQFSGGMKQRVVIAMALACNPDLLIADEPTTALDVTIQSQVLAMIGELKEKLDMGIILITHDLGIVAQICDNVAVMYAGEIIERGSIEQIFASPDHHPYTVGLFGSIPNLEEESRRLSPINGLMPDPTHLPEGCKFHPRCPNAMDICHELCPEDRFSDGHMIKCHLFMGREDYTSEQ